MDPSPSGYFNQTFTVEYRIAGSLDGTTLVPAELRLPAETSDPQQIFYIDVDGDAGLFDVDFFGDTLDRRGATGPRLLYQIWIVSPVAGSPGSGIDIVDGVDGAPVVQTNVGALGGQTTFFRSVPPVIVSQGSLLSISGINNPGPDVIRIRLSLGFALNLTEAQIALCCS